MKHNYLINTQIKNFIQNIILIILSINYIPDFFPKERLSEIHNYIIGYKTLMIIGWY